MRGSLPTDPRDKVRAPDQPRHRDGRFGRAVALIPLAPARAGQRLVLVLDGQDAEDAGDAGLELDLLDPVRGRRADVVVVVRLPSDHGPETNDGVIAAR